MLTDGLVLAEGSAITNATVAKGTSFPSLPDEGELFFRTDLDALHVYNGTQWIQVGLTSALLDGQPGSYYLDLANHTGTLAVSVGGTGVTSYGALVTALGLTIGTNVQAFDADLSAIAALAGTSGLLRKTAANTWSLDTASYLTGNQPITLSGDVSGSGNTNISVTLATVGTAGTYKSVTVNEKGLVTAGTNPTTLAGYGIVDAQALDADLTAIAALAGTSGFLKKTAANTWSLDTASYLPTTGGTMTGNLTMTGSIIPSANITYDLGSPTMMWKDIYVGPGSIYMNGQKILENVSQTVIFSADDNQNIRVETGGTGNLELQTGTSAAILVKSTMTVSSGKRILDSSGIQVEFGDNIEMNANRITGLAAPVGANDAATKTYVDGLTGNDGTIVRTTGDQTIAGNKTFSGNVTINGTFTSNATSVLFADNILEFNSDFTTGTPTEDAGFQVRRGDLGIVKFVWEEATDRFVMMNGVGGYLDLYTTGTITAGTFSGNATSATALATGRTFSLSGDATGTSAVFTGAANATIPMTLASSGVTAGSFGSASIVPTFAVDSKGRITSATNVSIDISAAQTTSGTFADARIAASNVTQHQAALTILESQITDGSIFPRLAGTEVVTGTWSFNNPINIGVPTTSTHAATKQYVDDLVNGVSWKSTARVATTANITLSGTQTIDGVAVVAGNRVLVKNQTTTSQNGVYVVAAGAWTRATDFDATPSVGEVNGAAVFITDGTVGGDTSWVQTATVTTIGTDPIVFAQFSGGAAVTAGANLTLTGNVIALNTTLTGLTSVTSTNFVGTLSGAAPAGSLSGSTLAAGVTASSLTSVGTLSSLAVGGTSTYAGQATFSGANVPVVLNGAAATARRIQINTAGTPRWQFGSNGTAESGSNAGSDFIFVRYDDAGSVIDQPFIIYRNTGTVQVNGALTAASVTSSFTGSLTGAASLNVLKTGDSMTGTLVTSIGGGATSSTKHIQLTNGSNYDLFMLPRAGAGSYGGLTQNGDALIGYSAGGIDTGGLVIGPWSASAKGIRIDVTGMVGIGTAGNLNSGTGLTGGLNVNGIITAGSTSSVGGSLILAGFYGALGATTTFGSEFSSGGPSIGYAVRPSTTASGTFTSTVGTSSLARGALTIAGDVIKFFTGSAQVAAVGSAVTMSERLSVDQNTMQFNGSNLRVNGSGNLLLQHDSTHAYIRPTNAGANLYLGAQATNTVLISSSGVSVTGTLFSSGQLTSSVITTNHTTTGTGYNTLRNGGASNTGYLEFVAANGNRQGYIGNSTTTAATDGGNIPYVAATHSFSGTIVGTLSGNSSGTHTGAVIGNASTATTLQTARTIALQGAVVGTATAFDGSGNISIPVTTLDASSLTTGTVPVGRMSGTYSISISGNAATATTATSATSATAATTATRSHSLGIYDGTSFVPPQDARGASGSRSADIAPNAYATGLFTEFKNSSLYGFTGNYTGLMTFAPWIGTTASTGDPSYQFAFHPSAANATSNPQLKFRAGIDTTWGAWTTVLTSLNYNNFAPQLNGTGASGTWGINITGTAPFANLVNRPVVADWPTNGATFVSGLMGWKNYGAGHVIFDASNGTAPNGASKSNSVPDNAWTPTYPTLMGWNGSQTYGVKVNYSDVAANASALGGYSPSVATAANSVVVRDGSGYIYNGYFNSVDNSQGSGVTAVMVKAGDNFLRSGTAAAVATFLSGQSMNIAGSAASLTALVANNASGVNPDNVTNNYIGYVNSGISLFGQTDGALRTQYFSASWMHQIYGDYRTGQLAVRGKNNGSLTAWRTVLDSSNYTSYSPSLTGSGASGTWGINITGNAATASSAGSTSVLIGAGASIFGAFGTSYGQAVQVREAGANGAQASAAGAAPRLGFHWAGVVASSIAIETSGRIAIHNNPGTGYENFVANVITAAGSFSGPGTGLTGTASGLSIGGNATSATSAIHATNLQSTSHPGTYWLTNAWDGTYWHITSNHGSPVRVGRADTAGTAAQLTGQAFTNGSDGWFRSLGTTGWYNQDYAVGIYATEAGNVRTYNGASFIAQNLTANGTIYSAGEITAFSDARIKTDVVVIPNALEKVEQVRGVTFTRTDEGHAGERQTGVIAQELEAVLPEAVRETDEGMKTVNYGSTVGLLIEAIKELSAQNKALMARLEALEAKE